MIGYFTSLDTRHLSPSMHRSLQVCLSTTELFWGPCATDLETLEISVGKGMELEGISSECAQAPTFSGIPLWLLF